VIYIISPVPLGDNHPKVARADFSMLKAFWPEVRGGYFFRHRRAFLDLMRRQGWKIFYISDSPLSRPPFILVGNWRDHTNITALWHIRAESNDRRCLVEAAVESCLTEGVEKVITKLLSEHEAQEFEPWGFEVAFKVNLLERNLYANLPSRTGKDGLEIVPFRKRALQEVLEIDASAFDDFWRLDAFTLKAIASSNLYNIFLLARSGTEIIGYAIAGTDGYIAYLQRLGVQPSHQGKGVGEELVASILQDLRRLGATTVMVNTQEDNLPALSLYRSMGFRETAGQRFIMQRTAQDRDRGTT